MKRVERKRLLDHFLPVGTSRLRVGRFKLLPEFRCWIPIDSPSVQLRVELILTTNHVTELRSLRSSLILLQLRTILIKKGIWQFIIGICQLVSLSRHLFNHLPNWKRVFPSLILNTRNRQRNYLKNLS